MKKFIIAIMLVLCSFGAYAAGENERVTSMGYVTEELAGRQDKFDKLGADTAVTYSGSTNGAVGTRAITNDLGAESNTSSTSLPTVGAVNAKLENKQDELDFAANTVLMNTGTAGEPTAKGIYQSSGDYNSQTDSLVDAATFNAALQAAINSELSCAQRKDPNDPNSKCLLFNIFAPTQNRIIPAEYTRLEYLESTGTQYIDTGIQNTHKVQMGINLTAYNTNYALLYGSQQTSPIIRRQMNVSKPLNEFLVISSGSAGAGSHSVSVNNGEVFTTGVYHEITAIFSEKPELILDGKIFTSDDISDNASTGLNDYLFCYNYAGGALYNMKAKMYFAKIWNSNNSLVRNFIPAKRNSDEKLGMYDTVSGTFFTNAGSGTFIAGPELSSNIYLPMN